MHKLTGEHLTLTHIKTLRHGEQGDTRKSMISYLNPDTNPHLKLHFNGKYIKGLCGFLFDQSSHTHHMIFTLDAVGIYLVCTH